MSFRNHVLAGAAGGLAGGLVMTSFMTIATRLGIIDTILPVKVARYAEEKARLDNRPSGLSEEVMAEAGHLVFSTALGALYGGARSTFRLPAFPSGPIFGAGLYALDLGIVGPATGVTKGPWDEKPTVAGRRLFMHVVFGTVTALVADKLRRREGGRGATSQPAHFADKKGDVVNDTK